MGHAVGTTRDAFWGVTPTLASEPSLLSGPTANGAVDSSFNDPESVSASNEITNLQASSNLNLRTFRTNAAQSTSNFLPYASTHFPTLMDERTTLASSLDPLVDALALDYLNPLSPFAFHDANHSNFNSATSNLHNPIHLLMRPRKSAKIHSGHLHATSGQHFHDDLCAGSHCLIASSQHTGSPLVGTLPNATSLSDNVHVNDFAALLDNTSSMWPSQWPSESLRMEPNTNLIMGNSAVPLSTEPNNDQLSDVFSKVIDLSYPQLAGAEEEECQHCLDLEQDDTLSDKQTPAPSAVESTKNGPITLQKTRSEESIAQDSNNSSSKPDSARKVGQRGKSAIVSIVAKTPGQYTYGNGDNLFVDVVREDGSSATISLRSSPTRCKTDLIEVLNLIPETVLVEYWRYFSVLLAKVDQSKPFKRLASPSLISTAQKLRKLNPIVNVPPAKFTQLHPSVSSPDLSRTRPTTCRSNPASPSRDVHSQESVKCASADADGNTAVSQTEDISGAQNTTSSTQTGNGRSKRKLTLLDTEKAPTVARTPQFQAAFSTEPHLVVLLAQVLTHVRAQDTQLRQLAGLHRETLLEVRALRNQVSQLQLKSDKHPLVNTSSSSFHASFSAGPETSFASASSL